MSFEVISVTFYSAKTICAPSTACKGTKIKYQYYLHHSDEGSTKIPNTRPTFETVVWRDSDRVTWKGHKDLGSTRRGAHTLIIMNQLNDDPNNGCTWYLPPTGLCAKVSLVRERSTINWIRRTNYDLRCPLCPDSFMLLTVRRCYCNKSYSIISSLSF